VYALFWLKTGILYEILTHIIVYICKAGMPLTLLLVFLFDPLE